MFPSCAKVLPNSAHNKIYKIQVENSMKIQRDFICEIAIEFFVRDGVL